MKPTYIKLILQDGKLVAVPDDYAGKHELVLVQSPFLPEPIVVAAYMSAKPLPWKKAIAAAEKMVICERPMCAMSVEEAFLSCDRTVHPALPVLFFPNADKHSWTWTSTVDAAYPADGAWFVDLDGGYAGRLFQSYDDRVRARCAGQFSELGVVLP